MNILATQYYAPKKAFEIYVSGCKAPHCEGCHNPESWRFDNGEIYSTLYFLNNIKDHIEDEAYNSLIENIFILGGEPLDQNINDFSELLFDLSHLNKNIWVFTKYNLNEIPQYVLNYADYIKCGRYKPELKVDDNIQFGIKLATSNQKIYAKGVHY